MSVGKCSKVCDVYKIFFVIEVKTAFSEKTDSVELEKGAQWNFTTSKNGIIE
jgi:hypothetical protein